MYIIIFLLLPLNPPLFFLSVVCFLILLFTYRAIPFLASIFSTYTLITFSWWKTFSIKRSFCPPTLIAEASGGGKLCPDVFFIFKDVIHNNFMCTPFLRFYVKQEGGAREIKTWFAFCLSLESSGLGVPVKCVVLFLLSFPRLVVWCCRAL